MANTKSFYNMFGMNVCVCVSGEGGGGGGEGGCSYDGKN